MVNAGSIRLIRQYIIDREGKATKSEVVNHMQNDVPEHLRLSRDTTMKVIENMNNIIISKGERRGQGHRLLIEDKAYFNQINNELTEIETAIDSMKDAMKKIKSLCNFDWRSVSAKPDRWFLMDLNDNFVEAYINSIESILESLLALASRRIQSQKDSSTIYRKIIELKIKLNEQHSSFDEGNEGVESMFSLHNSLIYFYSQDLEEIRKDVREYAENHGIPINKLTPNLVSKLKQFKVRFLPEYPEWGPKVK